MKILGIETSCDETAASIIEANPGDKKVKLLSRVISSSLNLHAKIGGIIPENAARQQIKYIIPVIEQALNTSHFSLPISNIDAIAITIGPGLIGSLLVGIETAKTLAFAWNKPIIPVNHLIGHIYANFICERSKLNARRYVLDANIEFPAIVLIASGGHTDLLLMKNHVELKWLGGTRDDAAGEAFDKIGRLLKLPYPGGPSIEEAAKKVNQKVFNLPRPMIGSDNFDFSFSGLKTAVLKEVNKLKEKKQFNNIAIQQLAYETQQAVIDVLVKKSLKAAKKYNVKSILLAGGVSANQTLRDNFELNAKRYLPNAKLFAPPKSLCTDNATMIATAAFFNYKPIHFSKITANPELYFN